MKPFQLNPDDLHVVTFETEAGAQAAYLALPAETEHTEDKLCTETACKPPEGGILAIAC